MTILSSLRRPFLTGLFLLSLCALPAHAATYTVTNLDDSGEGSLRQALSSANARPDADTISFATSVKGTITLQSGELPITSNLTINGPGANILAISGSSSSRIFNVAGNQVAISGLTLTGGKQTGVTGGSGYDAGEGGAAQGGAIYNTGSLSLTGLVITDNSVVGGVGGVGNDYRQGQSPSGDIRIRPARPGGLGGTAQGGAIFNGGTLALVNTRLQNNSAIGGQGGDGGKEYRGTRVAGGAGGEALGGAIYNAGSLSQRATTFWGNTAVAGVGGQTSGASGTAQGNNIYAYDVAPTASDATFYLLQGSDFQGQLVADRQGLPLTYSLVSGTLPRGLNLDSKTGIISGQSNVAGSGLQVTYRATNRSHSSNIATITFNITAATPTARDTTFKLLQGTNFQGQLVADGRGQSLTYTLVSGALPAGLSLDSKTGIISGQPTTPGNGLKATYRVANKFDSSNVATITFNVFSAIPITRDTTFDIIQGSNFKGKLWADGRRQPLTYSLVSGTLPAGLSLDSNTGIISGQPTTPVNGLRATYQVANKFGSSNVATVTFNVSSAIPTASDATFNILQWRTFQGQLVADGRGQSLTYVLVSDKLPKGLSLDSKTGIISGRPAVAVSELKVTYRVVNKFGNSNVATITFNVTAADPQSLIVTTTSDDSTDADGKTSLREAIDFANENTRQGVGPNIILFDLPTNRPQTIVLTQGQIRVVAYVTIAWKGSAPLTIIGQDVVFTLGPCSASMSGLKITGSTTGCAVYLAPGAELNISNSSISDNVLTDETAYGGAFYNNGGVLNIANCTISGNANSLFGGAIANRGIVSIINSTICNNSAVNGGGIYNWGTLTVDSCTIAGNKSTGSSFSGGIAGEGSATVKNSILAANLPGNTTVATTNSLVSRTYNAAGLDPRGLQNNGGPTQTIALVAGSPAIDAGQTSLATDQRGTARPQGKAPDIGAFEVVAPVVTRVSLTPTAPQAGDNLTVQIGAMDAGKAPLSYTYTWTRTRAGQNTVVRTDTSTSTGDVLPTKDGLAAGGDIITVSVVASNGTASSAPKTASVTITAPRSNFSSAGGS